MKDGTVRELEGGLIKLFTKKSGFSGCSYVVQNNDKTRDLKFTQGENYCKHPPPLHLIYLHSCP